MQPRHKQYDNWSRLLTQVGRQRDRGAFELLFNHFAPLIKGFCAGRANLAISAEAAEELVQTAMFNVWQKAPYFDSTQTSATAWIYIVARNARVELLQQRTASLPPELEVDDVWDDIADAQPFTFLERTCSEGVVQQRLQNLPLEQFHIVKKMYTESKGHNAISAELGLPIGTVRARAALAVKKLQALH